MALLLRQNTTATVKVGPFLDSTDGNTPETALTISQADVRLLKNGGAAAQKNDTNAATHDENGWYAVALNATDTNTLGRLQLAVTESGALPVWHEYMVMPAQVWDSFFGADALQVHAVEMSSGLITAAVVATDAIDADALAADALAEINAQVDTALADYDGPTHTELISEINDVQTDIAALNNLSAAQVNAEVVDALSTDTYAEPGAGAPAATISLAAKINYLYKFMRNRVTVTGSEINVYNDDATTAAHKSTHSDNGTTYDRGEFGAP